jgi:hypothetical protein
MTSRALEGLLEGLSEVSALQLANPTPQQGGGLASPEIVRVMGRAGVVLLSGHLERYLYALNEEAVECLLKEETVAGDLSDEIRLLHARAVVDDLARTQWNNRVALLRQYSELEADLWHDDRPVVYLDAARLMSWMKAPTIEAIIRVFRIWGIGDVFSAITRTAVTRSRLVLRINELVDKRNNIAHGDLTVEATHQDVAQYSSAVRLVCTRVDRRMARQVSIIARCTPPW